MTEYKLVVVGGESLLVAQKIWDQDDEPSEGMSLRNLVVDFCAVRPIAYLGWEVKICLTCQF